MSKYLKNLQSVNKVFFLSLFIERQKEDKKNKEFDSLAQK